MKNTKEEQNSPLSIFNSLIVTYHLELSNQLPNPTNYTYLSLLSPRDLISSLQLTINNFIESSLSNHQLQYETVLRHLESQIRTQYKVLNQMKLKKEAMANKITSLLMREDELDNSMHSKGLLAQKENEILILRAENSNLKAIHFKLNEEISQLQTQIEDLKKQFVDYNINLNHSNSNSNSNININDISNSKVLIKSDERYTPPLKKRKKNNSIHLYESNSNRNVLMTTYKNSLSPCKTTTQGSQCQTKPSVNSNYNISSDMHTILERGSFLANNASRWWNFIQGEKLTKKSPITNLKMNSSRQYYKGNINKQSVKSTHTCSPKTHRLNVKSQKIIK